MAMENQKTKEGLNFVIDVDPIVDFEEEKRNVPLYTVSHDYTSGKGQNNKSDDSRKVRSSQKCWNCNEEGHNLQMCRAPRNPSMVQKNRKAFMDAKDRKGENRNPKRYHEQNEQKYAKFKPGVISKRLRRALGLKRNQLPRHIYNMRHLGYPPGWLLEAQVLPSTIQMYDGTGERVPDPDDEEGEIESVHIKYNMDLIVDYPGFNVPPDDDVIEEANVLNAPLMKEEHSKQFMIEEILKKGQKFQVKGRTDGLKEGNDEDMEAEEIPELVVLPPSENCQFVPPLPLDELPPPPPLDVPPPPNESGEVSEGEVGEEWDSVAESNSVRNESTPFGTPTASPHANLGKVKSMSLGTPILKSASPYSKVPSYDNFRKGMGEVLNFENLPGSTGTYDKMLKVLQKVRNSLMGKK